LPFSGDPLHWRRAILAGEFSPVSQYIENAPQRWQNFFARSFALNRNERPRSAAEFLAKFEEAL
jgi:hypothetical protein